MKKIQFEFPVYSNVLDFYNSFLRKCYQTRIDTVNTFWDQDWRENIAAYNRIYALWVSWEYDMMNAVSLSNWFVRHADPIMQDLLYYKGPFYESRYTQNVGWLPEVPNHSDDSNRKISVKTSAIKIDSKFDSATDYFDKVLRFYFNAHITGQWNFWQEDWWNCFAAEVRINALWLEWENAVKNNMFSYWFSYYCDPIMNFLMSERGPFQGSSYIQESGPFPPYVPANVDAQFIKEASEAEVLNFLNSPKLDSFSSPSDAINSENSRFGNQSEDQEYLECDLKVHPRYPGPWQVGIMPARHAKKFDNGRYDPYVEKLTDFAWSFSMGAVENYLQDILELHFDRNLKLNIHKSPTDLDSWEKRTPKFEIDTHNFYSLSRAKKIVNDLKLLHINDRGEDGKLKKFYHSSVFALQEVIRHAEENGYDHITFEGP